MHYNWPLVSFACISLLLDLLSGNVQAAPPANPLGSDWELCDAPGMGHEAEQPALDATDPATYLSADQSEIIRGEQYNFSGDVLVRRADQQVRADSAQYNKPQDTVDAQGNVRYQRGGLILEGSRAHFELGTDRGNIDDTHFHLTDRHARGDATRILLEGPNQRRLKHARYTTCDTGNDDWYIHSSDIKLDHAKGVGTARHAWLEFKGVPFLYLPYVTFPLNNQRKSGFLAPSFGSSDAVGTELFTPYYWNIAPNLDATITPRFTGRRGVQMLGEFRYLNPTYRGQLDVGYLPNDNVTHDDRLFFSARHTWAIPRWAADINYNHVSDPDYFKELGTSLSASSITHLERRAEISYAGDNWSALGRLQGYQTVDETLPGSARPYQRLPQFLVNANLPNQWYGANYLFGGEYVHFARKESLTAQRVDLQPGVSLPLATAYGYLTPSLALRHTHYALEDETPGVDYDTQRTLPIFSADSGIALERDVSWGARNFLHTLEPRLFYLYVPYQDQAQIPVFDSGALEFNYGQLFSTNRYSGADRVGDANQLTTALTTRLLDSASGAERLSLSVGQIHYFRDRRVTLPGEAVGTPNTSDIVAQARAADIIPHWSASAEVQWDTQQDRFSKTAFGARYQRDDDHILNLTYRFRNDQLEQTDVSALWPLARNPSRQVNGVTRWNYSIPDSRTLELLAGVEYDTCCWTTRVALRRFVNDVGGETYNALFLQLELKGLTSFGHKGKGGLTGLLDPASSDRGHLFTR